jgi:hypothetical protein
VCTRKKKKKKGRKEKKHLKKIPGPKPVGNLTEERRREKITLGMMKYSGDKAVVISQSESSSSSSSSRPSTSGKGT